MAIPERLVSRYTSQIAKGPSSQAPMLWKPGSWRRRFSPHAGGILGDSYDALLAELASPQGSGSEQAPRIDREMVAGLASPEVLRQDRSTASPEKVVKAFIASMIWGYGKVGYGPYRTERVLFRDGHEPADRAISELIEVADRAQDSTGGGVKAFEHIAQSRRTNRAYLKYLGPAFGTKFIYFLTKRSKAETTPVMDSVVAGWIQRNAPEVARLNLSWWDSDSYKRYVDLLRDWASELTTEDDGGAPELDEIELLIFQDARDAPLGTSETENVTVESMLDDLGAEADARSSETDEVGVDLVESLRKWFAQNPSTQR